MIADHITIGSPRLRACESGLSAESDLLQQVGHDARGSQTLAEPAEMHAQHVGIEAEFACRLVCGSADCTP